MLNLNYNLNAANIERARFTEQENEAFRPFQIQYIIVPAGGGAAAGNNSFDSGSDIPKIGIAGNGGVIVTGSYCVQPLTAYPIIVGKGGAGGIKGITTSFTGSNGGDTSFYDIIALGGEGGKSQSYITASTFAGSGASTSASIANGGSGSQWTYNLPGCLPDPFNPGCHGGELISSSYYSGGGAGIVVSGSVETLTIEYAVIGGGGGGSTFEQNPPTNGEAGGGGAGGMVTGSFILQPIVRTYPIVVGAGGLKGTLVGTGAESANGTDGSGSSAFGVSTTGGKGGVASLNGDALGGNSGTGSWGNTTQYLGATTGLAPGGAGVTQNGATGSTGATIPERSGGKGGDGLQWVTGTYYAGGGGGTFAVGDQTYVGTAGLGQGNYGGGGAASRGNSNNNGVSGSVILRYAGTGAKATGGTISIPGDGYVYHTFTASANLVYGAEQSLVYTSGLPGVGGGGLFNVTGSSIVNNTGGGAAATFYTNNGASGSDGFVAIRYEGLPLAEGGTIVITDHYTYHLFSASADFYVIGQESNPNINPCP